MTIASEITRLQGAKADIKTAIENKGVEVPSNAKLDTYDDYIDQISTGIGGLSVFLPSTMTKLNAISNSNAAPYFTNSIYDGFSPNEDVYYHYFWYRSDDDTAESSFKIGVISKTAGNDMGFTGSIANYREGNYTLYNRILDRRMKKSGNDVIVSVLWTCEYDNNWHDPANRNKTYYSTNITNSSGTTETLGTIYGGSSGSYSQTDIDSMYAARTTSCGMSAGETLSSLGMTSISMPRASTGSSYYSLVATITYPS